MKPIDLSRGRFFSTEPLPVLFELLQPLAYTRLANFWPVKYAIRAAGFECRRVHIGNSQLPGAWKSMKLSAYIITVDAGFSPNPFGRYCTLACCKPTIRRKAEEGDIVVGTASIRMAKPRHLIYAMRVKWILPYLDYWRNSKFAGRKPSQKTAVSRRGDNIWHKEKGKWRVVANAYHDAKHRDRDISGENVLIATDFFYFGSDPIPVSRKFWRLLAKTQGHKNTYDCEIIDIFWKWVKQQARASSISKSRPKQGRIADPFKFTDDARHAHCCEIEEEDVEEC